MNIKKTTRRQFLFLSATGIAGTVLAACSPVAAPTTGPVGPTNPPAAAGATPAAIATQATSATSVPAAAATHEAPTLADMVKAGKLPALDQRLPQTPLVTTPVESVGKYGGTLHTATWWPQAGNVQLYFAGEAPIKWKADLTGYEPAQVESYEWSADGKLFTMHLRKGMKWSDGEPYTSDDWKFYWEDYALNPDQKLYTIPAYLRKSDGTPIEMEFPDPYTVVWKSDKAQWIGPFFMAQGYWEYAQNMMKPAHYLKQYHPKYASGKTWEDYAKIDQWWQTAGYPTLFAWSCTTVSPDGSRYVYTRNPFYWRVDTDGNQLPYIDAIDVENVPDEQTRILNCTQGKYDTAFRICGGPNDVPLLAQGAQAGGYHLLKGWTNGIGSWPHYMVNQDYVEGGKNYPDDTPERAVEIRTLFRDTRFRKALSWGVDRQRVIDVAWQGIGTPHAMTISPQASDFAGPEGQAVFKEWANTDIQFDPVKANATLDEIGTFNKGADGIRMLNGKPFTMVIDVSDWGGSLKMQTDAAAEVSKQWETNVGIKCSSKNVQGQPDAESRRNEGYSMLIAAMSGEIDIWTFPDWVFPVVNRYMFPLEGRYYAVGKETCQVDPKAHLNCGMKPEPGSPAERLQALYDKGLVEPDAKKRAQLVWDAVKIIETDGPFSIGISGDQPMPVYAKDYMHNIPENGIVGPWAPATPGNTNAAQWWMDV